MSSKFWRNNSFRTQTCPAHFMEDTLGGTLCGLCTARYPRMPFTGVIKCVAVPVLEWTSESNLSSQKYQVCKSQVFAYILGLGNLFLFSRWAQFILALCEKSVTDNERHFPYYVWMSDNHFDDHVHRIMLFIQHAATHSVLIFTQQRSLPSHSGH